MRVESVGLSFAARQLAFTVVAFSKCKNHQPRIISISCLKRGDGQRGLGEGRRGQRSKQVVDEDRGGRDNKQSPSIQLRRPGPSAAGTAPVGRRGSSRRPVSDSGSGGRQLPSVWTRGGRVVKKERAALPPPDPLRTL